MVSAHRTRKKALILGSVILSVVIALLAFAFIPEARLRAELGRSQAESGTTLVVATNGAIRTAIMADLDSPWKEVKLPGPAGQSLFLLLSNDGTHIAFSGERDSGLAIVQSDGNGLRAYQQIYDLDIGRNGCWSYDNSKLVPSAKLGTSDEKLLLLDLTSGVAQEIADERGHVVSQCWSPDEQEVVYYASDSQIGSGWPGTIRIYNVATTQSRDLVRVVGEPRSCCLQYPTWSPDGSKIAFFEKDSYYTVHPSGKDRSLLFAHEGAASALFWSPDSRFAAYQEDSNVGRDPLGEGGHWRLRLRRLSDGTEASFRSPDRPFHWITPPSPKQQ